MKMRMTLLTFALGVAACGDDSHEPEADSTTTTTTDASLDTQTGDTTATPDVTAAPDADATNPDATAPDTLETDTAVADTTAVDTVDDTADVPVVTPPDLSCIDLPDVIAIVPHPTPITVVVTDPLTSAPVSDATVIACPPGDTLCATPLASATTDATGSATVTLAASLGAFDGFIQVSGAGLVPTRWLPNPIIPRGQATTVPLVGIATAQLPALSALVGSIDATQAQVLVRGLDCAATGVAEATLAVDLHGSTTRVVYFAGGLPSDATTTDASGMAGIFNVPVGGTAVLTASYDGAAYGSYSFRPEAGFLYQLTVVPGPVVTTEVRAVGNISVLDFFTQAAFYDDVTNVRFANAPSCVLRAVPPTSANMPAGELTVGGDAIDPDISVSPDQCYQDYTYFDPPYLLANDSTVAVALAGDQVSGMPSQTLPTSPEAVVEVTSPPFDPDLGGFHATAGAPLDLAWVPPVGASTEQVMSFRMVVFPPAGTQPFGDLFCAFPLSAGSATIPGNVTAELALRVGSGGGGSGHLFAGGQLEYTSPTASYIVEVARGFDSTSMGGDVSIDLASNLVAPPEPAPPEVLPASGPTPSGSVKCAKALGASANVNAIAGAGSGFVVVGTFAVGLSLDPTHNLVTAGTTSGFVARYDASCAVTWAQAIDAVTTTSADAVAVGADGAVAVTGVFSGQLGSLTAAGGNDLYVRYFDADGNTTWTRGGGGTADERAFGVTFSGSDVIVSGRTLGNATFDTESVTSGSTYVTPFIVSYGAGGTIQWLTQVGDGEGADVDVFDIDATATAVTGIGNWMSALSFGPDPLDAPCGVDAFAFQLDADTGALTWIKRFGGPGFDFPLDVAVLSDGSSVLATSSSRRVTFDAGLTSQLEATPVGDGGFVAHLGADGTARSLELVDGPFTDHASLVAATSNGYVAAGTFGAYDAPGHTVLGAGEANATVLSGPAGNDVWLARYDSAGLVWARMIGGAGTAEQANGLAVDGAGNIGVIGDFTDTVTFDATSLTSVGSDSFLVIYAP
ncbi:MAG: hypothetical protein U1F43_29080 [Myxococcota bacterium]